MPAGGSTQIGIKPLSASPAFVEFQSGLGERCAPLPNPSNRSVVGYYGFGIELSAYNRAVHT